MTGATAPLMLARCPKFFLDDLADDDGRDIDIHTVLPQ